MDIIKVDAIDSTNAFLRELNRQKQFDGPVCVMAKEQLAGKGQMGTVWQSEPGKNLTCSVFMQVKGIELVEQFFISIAVSLAVCDALNDLLITKLSIKWPNDILSDRKKICGILIENVVKNGSLNGAIIGIGINVNQLEFDNLPQAGSLKKILGKDLEIEEVLDVLLTKLEQRFTQLTTSSFAMLKKEYERLLFRRNKPSTFLDAEGNSFVGIIQSVNNEGKLQVLLEDEIVTPFDLKEISLLY
ncbi:biotin--[acetyl-CoA-carboxylase] ligase [Aquimarina gracilis]|uniref:Biotin--[acetyl-CoA-carboxylase] ligase n=1 Tax=Aquimarina gracilis TaxID=874422 RepID=A0ABU5ZS86_9FLAO|nr:biotin--[acetyl-CoA-carboxylase] ligase [Aquimarina gracilis]MEB3344661.1 biotin--[acetyl-CoA-carboxylase] ligase [Aquimarina gracilis]